MRACLPANVVDAGFDADADVERLLPSKPSDGHVKLDAWHSGGRTYLPRPLDVVQALGFDASPWQPSRRLQRRPDVQQLHQKDVEQKRPRLRLPSVRAQPSEIDALRDPFEQLCYFKSNRIRLLGVNSLVRYLVW